MSARIEPLEITGANEFGKTLVRGAGAPADGISKENLEETLRSMPKTGLYYVTTELSIPLEASVIRSSGQEIVRLTSGEKSVELRRETIHQIDGDIGVSCNPDGDEVPVDTLNIHFRYDEHIDDLTDRGLVWVKPGNPATMNIGIKAEALKTSGKVVELVAEAEEAVRAKLLVHFQEGSQ